VTSGTGRAGGCGGPVPDHLLRLSPPLLPWRRRVPSVAREAADGNGAAHPDGSSARGAGTRT